MPYGYEENCSVGGPHLCGYIIMCDTFHIEHLIHLYDKNSAAL